MGVGMINGYIGIQNYRIPNIPTVEETVNVQENTPSYESVTQVWPERKPVITEIDNISIGFNKQNDYSYIGKDANIEQLDMQKAISDMQKDNLFKQYQFFVRSTMF